MCACSHLDTVIVKGRVCTEVVSLKAFADDVPCIPTPALYWEIVGGVDAKLPCVGNS